MRALSLFFAAALAAILVACGAGKRPTEPPGKSTAHPEIAGRVFLTQIMIDYYDPQKNINRAIVADKYFDKYWEIEFKEISYNVEEDHIQSSVVFFQQITTRLYFKDKKDLLKFGTDKGRPTGPRLVVGRAVNANKFEDCFIP